MTYKKVSILTGNKFMVCMKPICLVLFICFVGFNSFGQCNPPLLKNPSFESPVVSRLTYITIPIQGGDFGWSATHRYIEMWKSNAGNNAADGTQFIELNNASNMRIGGAPNVYKLWQDIDTSPGQVLTISFAHKSRKGSDKCELQIGAIAAPVTCVTASGSNTSIWKTYTCTYTVPANQLKTRIQFIGTPSGLVGSEGNLLDHIMITSNEGTTSNVTAKCTSDVVNLPPASTSTWIAASTNPSPTVIASDKVSGFAITGTYTYTLFTGACTNTIIIDVLDQNPSTPTVASNSPVLVGGQLNLTTTNVGGLSYTWSGPNGYKAYDQNPSISSVSTTMSGLYTLVTTSAIGGCQSPPATTLVYINEPV